MTITIPVNAQIGFEPRQFKIRGPVLDLRKKPKAEKPQEGKPAK